MSRSIKEWLLVVVLVAMSAFIAINIKKWNQESTDKVVRIEYIVTEERANLRSKPSKSGKIIEVMRGNHFVDILDESGNWLKVRHRSSKKEGWAHKIVMGRYLVVGYYQKLYLGNGVHELKW